MHKMHTAIENVCTIEIYIKYIYLLFGRKKLLKYIQLNPLYVANCKHDINIIFFLYFQKFVAWNYFKMYL